MTKEEIIKEFDKIWADYPRNQKENSVGLDYLIKQFLLNIRAQDRKEIIDMIEEKIIEPNEFGYLSERGIGKNSAYRKILKQLQKSTENYY